MMQPSSWLASQLKTVWNTILLPLKKFVTWRGTNHISFSWFVDHWSSIVIATRKIMLPLTTSIPCTTRLWRLVIFTSNGFGNRPRRGTRCSLNYAQEGGEEGRHLSLSDIEDICHDYGMSYERKTLGQALQKLVQADIIEEMQKEAA